MTCRAADDFDAIRARMEELRAVGPGIPAASSPAVLHTTSDSRCSVCGGLVQQWIAQECNGACMGLIPRHRT